MPQVSQEPIPVPTVEEGTPSQIATQAGSPAGSEHSAEGEPEGVARPLDLGTEPETPQTADSVTTELFENIEAVDRLALEGGGLVGGDAPPENASEDDKQPAAGAVRVTSRPLGNLPDKEALAKRTFDYSQYCHDEVEVDIPRSEFFLDLDAVCFHHWHEFPWLSQQDHTPSFVTYKRPSLLCHRRVGSPGWSTRTGWPSCGRSCRRSPRATRSRSWSGKIPVCYLPPCWLSMFASACAPLMYVRFWERSRPNHMDVSIECYCSVCVFLWFLRFRGDRPQISLFVFWVTLAPPSAQMGTGTSSAASTASRRAGRSTTTT